MTVVAPILIGVLYVCLMSLIRAPHRRRFNAVMVAGAGAAYISGGGFGPWELVITTVIAYCAYRGLESWTFIGIAWLLHTGWDLLHHLQGNPIVPFVEHSSFGCAICDPVIAAWCFTGGPSVTDFLRSRISRCWSTLGPRRLVTTSEND
ncbi:DUF6010 family protein [Streptomyces sp. NPDC019443]|uniref:DUF6010 family protein n=1 Tax=Streptomyces sp. NPDC019443 TaxID=3365061 RepID=UPI0037A67B22